ncbi:MAG TPA: site-specific integrase [Vicinamibacterales bacterium]|nr:site-specific integrase [Vicinamibacterales bacterium]
MSLDKVSAARNEPRPTSKTEALRLCDILRAEIRSGTFADPNAPRPAIALKPTFADVAENYLLKFVRIPTRRPRGAAGMEILISMARRAEIPAANGTTIRLEEKAFDEITKADIEAVREWRQRETLRRGRALAKDGRVGLNRMMSRLRHLCNWAIENGFRNDTPFKIGAKTVIRLDPTCEQGRDTRLAPGDEARLLAHASPHMRSLIVAALSTGCRVGELLSLQWHQIRRDDRGEPEWLVLPGAKTKTGDGRTIPIGSKLRAELWMRRHGPDGREHAEDAYIFGEDDGEQVRSIRSAWRHTCQRSGVHGVKFHDLRREFASRLLESSARIHDVAAFLGHANVSTTSTYLKSTPVRLAHVLERMEQDGCARLVHNDALDAPPDASKTTPEHPANLLN